MKISENVELIDGTLANSYAVFANDKTFLIDAGTKGSGKKIISYFQKTGKKPDVVLITHYHPDHIGGLSLIHENFKPMVYVPDSELQVVKGQAKIIPAKSIISHIIARFSKINPVQEAEPLSKFSHKDFTILPTPGHTPQSTSYIFNLDKVIFIGDAFSIKKDGSYVINRTFTLNIEEAKKSMESILAYKGYTVAPGHGSTFIIK